MARLWCSAARPSRFKSNICPILGLFGLCCAALPGRAQESSVPEAPPAASEPAADAETAEAPAIRAADNGSGKNARIRFSLGRLLRDLTFGVAWDRARIPFNTSLRGNGQDPVSIKLTLSRRDFSGVTMRLRF
uniref:Copper amine oxidase-like N-terminal domain-containing protein n=1 Tax=uncultured Armatimonadetes bacterium TaxID=157466 RepID=A0A6J4K104_9BACT|nr:hypothetical protein AVDCRST_MAG63-4518 [uncultured Armatimonadetes bacterium]